MSKLVRRLSSLMVVLVLILSMSSFAFAAEDNGSFTAVYKIDGETPIAGMQFNVYKIATYPGYGSTFYLTEQLTAYHLTLPDFTDDIAVSSFMDALVAYISRDGINPDLTVTTDEDGKISLSDLDLGMYIVVGQTTKIEDTTYSAVPFILYFPYATEEGEAAFEADDVEVKTSYVTDEKEAYHVLKVWSNDTESTRPESIDVDLMMDGILYDTVTLSEENDWRYTWSELEAGHTWTLIEDEVPSQYRAAIDLEGATFVVTNTYQTPSTPSGGGSSSTPSTPSTTDTPVVVPSVTPETPALTEIIDGPPILAEFPDVPEVVPEETPEEVPEEIPEETTPEPTPEEIPEPDVPTTTVDVPEEDTPKEKIPQTGQLWYPVPILAVVGLLFILCGKIINRKKSV